MTVKLVEPKAIFLDNFYQNNTHVKRDRRSMRINNPCSDLNSALCSRMYLLTYLALMIKVFNQTCLPLVSTKYVYFDVSDHNGSCLLWCNPT